MRIVRLKKDGLSAGPFYHHVVGSNWSATAKAEARRNDRRLRRREQARASVRIELITWNDPRRDPPPPSEWIELITSEDRHRDPPPVTIATLPNPFQ